jgi:hypothetical protein
MLFRSLDSSHDWNFGQGTESYVSGEQAIGLNIQTRILSFMGNCYFDMLAGINWFIYFGTPGKQQQTLLSVQAEILQSYGVTKVNSVTMNETDTGGVILTFNIYDIYSPTAPYSQTLQVNSPAEG